ncbi:hypothetical protein N9Z27_02915 [Alphaproteobacteria bacterium]|nr:hypothetical protein [Alphaproteobacteria bacterium]
MSEFAAVAVAVQLKKYHERSAEANLPTTSASSQEAIRQFRKAVTELGLNDDQISAVMQVSCDSVPKSSDSQSLSPAEDSLLVPSSNVPGEGFSLNGRDGHGLTEETVGLYFTLGGG